MLIVNAILVTLIVMQRLGELRVSKQNRRRLSASGAAVIADPVFPWMVFAHVLLIGGSLLEPWLLQRTFLPVVGWTALGCLVVAQVVRFWTLRTLGRHWNVRIMASAGQGVVASGPYRFVRHPNYAIVIVEALCLPLFHGAYLTLAVVQLLQAPVLAARIKSEERYLLSVDDYRRRMGDKPRLVPRFWRRPVSRAAR